MLPVPCEMVCMALNLVVRQRAELAGVSSNDASRSDAGEELKPRTVAAVRSALESAGVIFVEENGEGPGVRLRKSAAGSKIASIPLEDLNAENDE